MRNWSVKKRIAAAFGVTIAVFLIAGVLAFLDLLRVRRHANLLLIDTLPGLSVNGEVNDLIQSHEAAMQHRRNARSAAEQSQLDAELAAYEKKIRERFQAYPATITRDSDRTLFARLTDSYGLYERAARTAMATPTEGAYLNLARTHTRVSIDARALLSDNGKAGLAAAASVDAVARATQIAVITAMLIAILVALLAGLWLYRSITRPLSSMVAVADRMRQGNFSSRITVDRDDELGVLAGAMNRVGEELGTLINGVQSSGIQVSTSATEIAATTAEIGATSREISATSKELSKTMTDIVRVSESAASVAVSGQAGILRMQETMQQIIDASAAVATKLADVNERAGNISLVVTTITKVADQTNLLSLNAAIEAEKAGEYGRGFSVVASEIRRLADQTAIATQDIEKTVTKMQSAVASGVMGMEKFGDQVRTGVSVVRQVGADLQSIIEQVQTLAPAFESVNEGMQGQSVAAEQISEALAQLSESAQQTVESLSQSNSAIEQLNDVTRGLRQGVSRFTFES